MLRNVADTDVRLETVQEHMRLENLHDFPGCAAKFGKATIRRAVHLDDESKDDDD